LRSADQLWSLEERPHHEGPTTATLESRNSHPRSLLVIIRTRLNLYPYSLKLKRTLILNSGVNFNDIMTRNGMLDTWVRSLKVPFIMGSEVAGEVVGLGRNVINLKVN
jgi:hypothetical protein